jgi:hypothetical protein
MRKPAALIVIPVFALAGCASTAPQPPEATRVPAAPAAEPVPPPEHRPRAGEIAVAALGTPFFIAFKAAVCAGTVAVAAPSSAIVALADPHTRREGLAVLGHGVEHNCGPPYVLMP